MSDDTSGVNFQPIFKGSFRKCFKCTSLTIQWIRILVGDPVLKYMSGIKLRFVRLSFFRLCDPTNLPKEQDKGLSLRDL